jgi:hypothetical protein
MFRRSITKKLLHLPVRDEKEEEKEEKHSRR